MTPALLDALKADRRRVRSEVAIHAARALVIQPEQFEPMTALDMLLSVPYMREERADEVLRAAGVYPLRRGADLHAGQRAALARQLARFAKAGRS